MAPFDGASGFAHDVGIAWLALGVAGLLFRGVQLTFQQSVLTALAWMTKIVTDPFHDILLYWKSPFALLRGEWIDPMTHIRSSAPVGQSLPQHLADEPATDPARG